MREFLTKRTTVLLAIALAAALAWTTIPAAAGDAVVVKPDGVEPAVLHAKTGARVDFINETGRAVHLEFAGDERHHEVVQIPAIGPMWVVFHRPGPHPYAVHVYEPKERTLRGVVEVTDEPGAPPSASACGVTALGVCIEP